jgi:hypothetical protein
VRSTRTFPCGSSFAAFYLVPADAKIVHVGFPSRKKPFRIEQIHTDTPRRLAEPPSTSTLGCARRHRQPGGGCTSTRPACPVRSSVWTPALRRCAAFLCPIPPSDTRSCFSPAGFMRVLRSLLYLPWSQAWGSSPTGTRPSVRTRVRRGCFSAVRSRTSRCIAWAASTGSSCPQILTASHPAAASWGRYRGLEGRCHATSDATSWCGHG